jgi:hypothetical protein
MRQDEYLSLPDDLALTCPYCGYCAGHAEFMSAAQRERVLAAARGLAEQLVHGMFNDMMSQTFNQPRSARPGSFMSVEMSYTPGSPPPIRELPGIAEAQIQRVIECSSCSNHHAVYSATSFCPVCGPRAAADKVLEAATGARQALSVEDRLNRDEREQLRSIGVFERFAVDAIESVVSLFETFAREQFYDRAPRPDEVVRGKGNVFQRLDDTRRLLDEHAGVDLAGLVGVDRWRRLQLAFAQRHLLAHQGGIVDQRFLDQAPGFSMKIGQRLVISRRDASVALDDFEVLVRQVRDAPRASV